MTSGLAFSAVASRYAPRCGTSAYRPAGFLGAAAEARRLGYYAMMSDIACEYGIPTGLFDAMIIRESGYQAAIYSPRNAFGLTQLMPDTAEGLGVNRYDIEQNLRGGARYLRQQLDRFGQVHLALAAYNAGPGRVRNGVLPRIGETQAYVDNVLSNWQRLAGLARTATVQPADMQPAGRPKMRIGRTASISTF
ncbi:lytic transglycosylase (plasmid) [Sphingomonas panacis]|uniref:Lytic transglycosylase n=2 Tax=Sphingomonas panacis TaxID=1560345 RepID=A0A1B3ZIR8_9SPHN|nr:lytic transglycosylase [Sphingomonas panacis]